MLMNMIKKLKPTCVAVILCVSTMFIYWMSYMDINNVEYPLKDGIVNYDPYVQQFDAFVEGQLYIDYEPDDELLALDNPYDREERKDIEVLWDRVLYNGKYYSYFGLTPIITVMFPFYLITGMLPGALFIQFVYIGIFSVFFPKLVMMLLDRYGDKVHWGYKVLLTYVTYLSSFNLLFGRGNRPFYYIACTSAIAFLTLFAYLFLKGIFANEHKKRCTYFLAAGLMYAFCIHSRINTAFMGLFFIVPIVIFRLFLDKQKWKNKLKEIACLGIFAVLGLVLALSYNYARFGNAFEFGTTYQITVADVSQYKLEISEFDEATEYYFESTFIGEGVSGRRELCDDNKENVDRYLYVSEYFGLFTVPILMFSLMAFIIVFVKGSSKTYKITLISTVVGSFIMAWINFCLGGVIYRYLADFSTEVAVCAALGVLFLLQLSYKFENKKLAIVLRLMLTGVMIISVYKVFQIMSVDSINFIRIRENSFIGSFL